MVSAHRGPAFAFLCFLEEIVGEGPPRHTHRAFYYTNILFISLNKGILKLLRGITLFSRHETGTQLHGRRTATEKLMHVSSRIDSTSRNNRDLLVILFFYFMGNLQDII